MNFYNKQVDQEYFPDVHHCFDGYVTCPSSYDRVENYLYPLGRLAFFHSGFTTFSQHFVLKICILIILNIVEASGWVQEMRK